METTEFMKQLRLALALGERKEVDRLLSLNAFSDDDTAPSLQPKPRVQLKSGVFYSVDGIKREV